MGPSPYDIAWLARLRNSGNGDARWPDLLEWLLENQHSDGSWGGETVYYHDRIICTLAAIVALRESGHTRQVQKAIGRAERYLWHHLHLLPRDPFELVGFELIFPTLLGEALALGLDVPIHTCGYGEIQTAKLRLIPPRNALFAAYLHRPLARVFGTIWGRGSAAPGTDHQRLAGQFAGRDCLLSTALSL